MKDCSSCKFENFRSDLFDPWQRKRENRPVELAFCRQGHVRKLEYDDHYKVKPIPIENCHAWEEME
jgi:hypothetical protein